MKYVRKRKMIKYLSFILMFVFIIGIGLFIKNTFFYTTDSLINITKLPDDFMNNYFQEIGKATYEEKSNMLIVISKYEIEESYGATKVIPSPNNQYILQYSSEEDKNKALEQLKKDNRIYSVEENNIQKIAEGNYNSWGVEKMSLDTAMDTANSYIDNLQPVTVAIIDTGCDMTLFNKYYAGRIEEIYNVLESSNTNMLDENGHGTHIAGTIAESTPNNVKILPIKVSTDGTMFTSDVISAINYVVRYEKADVINMSFGGYYRDTAEEQAVNAAADNNIIAVAAAGNDNTKKEHYPSAFESTISIASVDENLSKSSFSNYGTTITFAAPGRNIKSIMSSEAQISAKHTNTDGYDGDDDHETISGTSMSTPHAVSAVAILKSYNKNLSLEDTVEILKQTATDIGEPGWDENFGYGLISFYNANFCNGHRCDKYGIYTDLVNNISTVEITNVVFTNYNYSSEANLMGTTINVSYGDGTSLTTTLGELPDVEILNYDPNSNSEQTVTIRIRNEEVGTINVTNPSNYNSGWTYNELENGQIEITGYKDHGLNIKSLVIPTQIDGKTVYSIADNFKFSESGSDIENYENLYLPAGLVRIGNYAFAETNIKHVYGTDTKIEVGEHAFEDSGLITIDAPIEKIEDYAFKNCYELTQIKIQSRSSINIGQYAFYNCKKLTAFRKADSEAYTTIGDVGDYAFYNCVSLSYFEENPLGTIGDYAFYNTFLLFDLSTYNSDSIGKYAFYESGIKEAEFSTGCTIIEQSAFEGCSNLKKVSFNGEKIESRAFWNSGVEEINISDDLTYLADDAFAYSPVKTTNGGHYDNARYTAISRTGIVDNTNNKLIVGFTDNSGFSNTKITEEITEIGDYAFTGNDRLTSIVIPETVTKIDSHTFQDCHNLSYVFILNKTIDIDDNAFIKTVEGEVKDAEILFYVYKDSQIKQKIKNKKYEYRHIDPDEVVVSGYEEKYEVSSRVDENKLNVKLIYHEEEDREEELSSVTGLNNIFEGRTGFEIKYIDEVHSEFNADDTYFIVYAYNRLGYLTTKNVNIKIKKEIPEYTIPTGLTANIGQELSEIALPEGFEWMDEDQTINQVGEVTYKAKYVPADTVTYEIVENIDITITVTKNKTVVKPLVSVADKVYDGTTTIPTTKITILNIEDSIYTIVSATSSSANAGPRSARVKLKLTNNDYIFDDGKTEKEFTASMNITKADINLVDNSKDVTTNYDGKLHTIETDFNCPAGAIIKYMNENNEYVLDTAPSYKEVGEYVIKYKVSINDNYNAYLGEKKLTILDVKPYTINTYTVDESTSCIRKITSRTTLNKFNSNIVLSNGYEISVQSKELNGEQLVYTGAKATIKQGQELYKEYILSVKGDTNGDGLFNEEDISPIKNYILRQQNVVKEFNSKQYLFDAADYSDDGRISLKDYMKMRTKHIIDSQS